MQLIHPLIVLRILSTILFTESLSLLVCIPVALICHEPAEPFALSAIIVGMVYVLLKFATRKTGIKNIGNRDTFLIVFLAWVLFPLFGTLPYILSGTIPSFINAVFESTSGFTTTGASILNDVERLPLSILFWRSFTHWIGGLGIVVLVILILPGLKVPGYHLFSLESSMKEKIHPKVKGVALRILAIYTGLTVLETILLAAGDMNLFDSICHAFGTIATGGFSTKNTSIAGYSHYTQYIVMVFMLLAGISQVIYYYLIKFNFKKVIHNEELWFYFSVVLFAGTVSVLLLYPGSSGSFGEVFREGFFQTISVITCTGFASADYLLWPAAGLTLIFLLMFAGGSTGSTSGGIKMARHLIVAKSIKAIFKKLIHPDNITIIKMNGKALDEKTISSIVSFIFLYFIMFLAGSAIITVNGSDLITSLSSTATCMAGIGPGLGTVGPMSNYSMLPGFSKIVLCLAMIAGRLEIIPVIIIFGKSFWKV